MEAILTTLSTLIKKSEFKVKHQDKKRKPWITNGLVKACNTKLRLHKTWRNGINNKDKKEKYKKYCRYLKLLLKQAKDLYTKNQIESIKKDNKKFWKFANNNFFGKKKKSNDIESIVLNEQKINDNKGIASAMNSYFASIGSHLNKKKVKNKKSATNFTETIINESFFIQPTDPTEIQKIIKTLVDQTAAGMDGIGNKIIKLLSDHLSKSFTHIFNLSVENGYYPKHFKKAVIIPIYKNGSRDNVSNYRPISLTSNFAKIFEKLIKIRLNSFLTKHNIISEKQFGFKGGVFTKMLLLM